MDDKTIPAKPANIPYLINKTMIDIDEKGRIIMPAKGIIKLEKKNMNDRTIKNKMFLIDSIKRYLN
ncbi:MAG: hypothetical protein A2474_02685 [Elusimicrobia bacterium RIFOXYC2_FULL_34_12]|nr:MAG: hypothetical protein A2474_02685 [Elusimicrobia bacterium RIFOXYC2_FULL_34_12]OGS38036.1 MAG: hypothetical protein A2551_01545 [Elusimicrobia bacterium RIFOXYD2_FULL_34_30]